VVPRIVFTKGGGLWLPEMQGLACDVLGLDWTMNLGRARQRLATAACTTDSGANGADPVGANGQFDAQTPHPTALQGNIDPNVLFAPPEAIRKPCVMLVGIDADGLVRTAVDAQVGLGVPFEVVPPQRPRAFDGRLENPGLDRPALPDHLARQAHVQGNDAHPMDSLPGDRSSSV